METGENEEKMERWRNRERNKDKEWEKREGSYCTLGYFLSDKGLKMRHSRLNSEKQEIRATKKKGAEKEKKERKRKRNKEEKKKEKD